MEQTVKGMADDSGSSVGNSFGTSTYMGAIGPLGQQYNKPLNR